MKHWVRHESQKSVSPLTFYFEICDISKHTSCKIQAKKVHMQWWYVAKSREKTVITKKAFVFK